MVSSSASTCRSDAGASDVRTSGSPEVRKSGRIRCETVDGTSALTEVRGGDPLKLIPVRGRGPACTVCVATYGGGFLAGDRVDLDVGVGPGAALVLSTQAHTKVYRSDGAWSENRLSVTVADGGLLALLPDPLTPYATARFRQVQDVDLNADAGLILLDWMTSGRQARGEHWAFDQVDLRSRIRIGGRLRCQEALTLRGPDGGDPRWPCFGSILVAGPGTTILRQDLASACRDLVITAADLRVAASIHTDLLVLRFAAAASENLVAWLRPRLTSLHDRLGGDPWHGRH